MAVARNCTRTGCTRHAVATLTYAYADLTAVVGPLAGYAEPHSYDLCNEHARRLTVPRGWEVMRHEGDYTSADWSAPVLHEAEVDDLAALADLVNEPLPEPIAPIFQSSVSAAMSAPENGRHRAPDAHQRRAHLRVVPDVS